MCGWEGYEGNECVGGKGVRGRMGCGWEGCELVVE